MAFEAKHIAPSAMASPLREPATPAADATPMDSRVRRPYFVGSPSADQTPSRRLALKNVSSNKEPMKVFLRVRPMKEEEKQAGEQKCLEATSDTTILIKPPKDNTRTNVEEATYTFTKVFDASSTQTEVYEATAAPLVESFLNGSPGLIFTYGNTNAGKTYTIQGKPAEPGLLPQILQALLTSIPTDKPSAAAKAKPVVQMDTSYRYALWASYLEIYNENIYDLLSEMGKPTPLLLKEDKEGRVFVKDLAEKSIGSFEEGMKIMETGLKNRQVAQTILNQDSSRSHSVFTIKLIKVPKNLEKDAIHKDPSLIKFHKLSIVDLAGSERAKRTQNEGARLKEASVINNSLMTFGRCLEVLRNNQKNANPRAQMVVPFRDSKLTRLFQDYFIGIGKATMIVNVNPCGSDFNETTHVLQFSAVARDITTNTKLDTGLKPRSAKKKREGEDDDEAAHSAELLRQVQELQLRLMESENQLLKIESDVREEVTAELQENLQQMEKMYDERKQSELEMLEEKYEKKVAIFGKTMQQKDQQIEQLTNELTVLKSRCEAFVKCEEDSAAVGNSNKKNANANGCKDCQTLKNKCNLLNSLMEGMEQTKQKEIAYEKQKLTERFTAEREQIEANYKIEISNLKAQVETEKKKFEDQVKVYEKRLAEVQPKSGVKVIHHARPSDDELSANIQKARVVTSPPEKDELVSGKNKKPKFDQYEVADKQRSPPGSPTQLEKKTIWKGQVKSSLTGDGVSVMFTEKEVIEKRLPAAVGVQGSPLKLTAVRSPNHSALDRAVSAKDLLETKLDTTNGFDDVPLEEPKEKEEKKRSGKNLFGNTKDKEKDLKKEKEAKEKEAKEKEKREKEEAKKKEKEKAEKEKGKKKADEKLKKDDKKKKEEEEKKGKEPAKPLTNAPISNAKKPQVPTSSVAPATAAAVKKAEIIPSNALSPDHLNISLSKAKRDGWLMSKGKGIAQSFLNHSPHNVSQLHLAHPKVAMLQNKKDGDRHAVRVSDILASPDKENNSPRSSIGSAGASSPEELSNSKKKATKRRSSEADDSPYADGLRDSKKNKVDSAAVVAAVFPSGVPSATPIAKRLRGRIGGK